MKFENKNIYTPKPVMTYHLVPGFDRSAGTKEGDTHPMIFSTEVLDRHQTIKRVKGAQLKNYKNNPVYLWAHNGNIAPIGTVKKVTKQNSPPRLVAHVNFDQEDEFARFIEGKFIRGFLNANSIGFIPLEWESITERNKDKATEELIGYDILKYELLEGSAVPVPSDFEALKADRSFFNDMEWERYIEEFNYPLPKGWEKRTTIIFDSDKSKANNPKKANGEDNPNDESETLANTENQERITPQSVETYLKGLNEKEWQDLATRIFGKEKDERLIEMMDDNPREKLNDFLQKIQRFLKISELADLVKKIE